MAIKNTTNGSVVTIQLGKNFDFENIEDFRQAYIDNQDKSFVIDFRDTEHMDSSGLGMLMNMRKSLGEKNANITLTNCRNQIKTILTISHFERKFKIT